MSYLQIAILALIQGAAEMLPVSSSAHVIFVEHLLGVNPSTPEATFLLVMLHTGTMFAVLIYFFPRWRALFRRTQSAADGADATRPALRFVKMLVLATVCTAILGFGLKKLIEKVILERLLGHPKGEVEQLFKNLPLIAAALLAVGIFILLAAAWERRSKGTLSPWSAIWIGLIQGLCLPFRGFSRSGATISTGLLCGVPRALSEDFSFALAVVLTPAVIVHELHRLLEASDWPAREALPNLLLPGLVGMGFSFVAGLVALRLLSALLERGHWKYFGYYCLVAAAVVFVAAFGFGVGATPPADSVATTAQVSAP